MDYSPFVSDDSFRSDNFAVCAVTLKVVTIVSSFPSLLICFPKRMVLWESLASQKLIIKLTEDPWTFAWLNVTSSFLASHRSMGEVNLFNLFSSEIGVDVQVVLEDKFAIF